MEKFKRIGYAYPSSSMAKRLGRAGYFLEVLDGEGMGAGVLKLYGPYDNLDDAQEFAREEPELQDMRFARYSMGV